MMGLKFEVESLDGLDDGIKSMYKEHGGKFRLDVEGIDPADELKGALAKEREERKKKGQESEDLRKALQELQDERDKKNGEYKSVAERTQKELEDLRNQHRETLTKWAKDKIAVVASEYAGTHAVDKDSLPVLREFIEKELDFVDGEVTTKSGAPVDEAINEMMSRPMFSRLIKGNQSSGGGASGGQGGKGAVGNMGGTRHERAVAIATKLNLPMK